MNEKNLKIRTEAVCKSIIKEKAELVFLQEVTPESESIIWQYLHDKFEIFSGNVDGFALYYTLTLVAKNSTIKVQDNQVLNFRQSLMGRNLLKTNVFYEISLFWLIL